jgi:hypothetical protein
MRSGRNGLVLGLIVTYGTALPDVLGGWFLFHDLVSVIIILPFAFIAGVSLGLFFGLSAFLKHFVLRFWLWLMDRMPWHIVAFLDEMVERILLRRVGGSYIFIHRFLLDYFASLTPAAQLELSGAAKVGVVSQAKHFRRLHLQPKRIFNKRWNAVLVAFTCLFLVSSFITWRVREAGSAEAQQFADFQASMLYPAPFPGRGQLSMESSLQLHDIMSLGDDPAAGCYAREDGYHISQKKLHTTSFCGYNNLLSDVAIQVDMIILHGDCGGIAFRRDPHTGSGYFFYVCQNGIYGLRRDDSPAHTTNLIPSTSVPGGLLYTDANMLAVMLAVVTVGSTIMLFINEQQIVQLQDKHYMQGVFSFAAYAMQNPTEVLYSDMRVWNVDDN